MLAFLLKNRAVAKNEAGAKILFNGVSKKGIGLFAEKGGEIINSGEIKGNNTTILEETIGMVIQPKNGTLVANGTNTGTIELKGTKVTGVYNQGVFDMTAGSILTSGEKSISLYANNGATTKISKGSITAKNAALGLFADTWYGMTIILFLYCVIYSMGISTWVLTPMSQPLKLQFIAANLAMVAAGTATAANLHIFTETFIYTCYLWVGGVGATLSLVILMCFSKSKELKALGKACLVPSIFNINEPVVFGAIAWNPLLMVPMWIQGIVLPLLTWLFTKVIPFAPIPRIQFELWYTPYPISTFISTQGSILGVLFAIVTFLLSGLIWYPFFKAYEAEKVAKETLIASSEK